MHFDQRCKNFVNKVVDTRERDDGDDYYFTETFACGCFHSIISENTPGYREHDDFYSCEKCKLKGLEPDGLTCFDRCYINGEDPSGNCVSCDVCPHREECSGYDDDDE